MLPDTLNVALDYYRSYSEPSWPSYSLLSIFKESWGGCRRAMVSGETRRLEHAEWQALVGFDGLSVEAIEAKVRAMKAMLL